MLLYNLIISLYATVLKMLSPFHKKAGLMLRGQGQTNEILRRGIDPKADYIWFHASSLGEFEQGRPMMERIKAEHPTWKILLTFFSPSGYEVRKDYKGADMVCYLPFDTPKRVSTFLDLARPKVAVFIKYEFWMNYLSQTKARDIPIYIISAIFRPEQAFFRWYGSFYRKALHCFSHLFVQDKASQALLASIGIENVSVCGDTRFDRVLDIRQEAQDIAEIEPFLDKNKTILIAGSSWQEDEAFLIPYFNEHPNLKLILAPHEIHEAHLLHIEALLKRPAVRFKGASKEQLSAADCVIINCFGQLASIYRYGQIAYIGGGFRDGIHNTLEAAVYGIPVLFGPNHQKFKEAVDLLQLGGGFSVSNQAEFIDTMDKLLANTSLQKESGEKARTYVHANAGVTEKIMKHLGY